MQHLLIDIHVEEYKCQTVLSTFNIIVLNLLVDIEEYIAGARSVLSHAVLGHGRHIVVVVAVPRLLLAAVHVADVVPCVGFIYIYSYHN